MSENWDKPVAMTSPEKTRIRMAAHRATKLFPPAVARMISQELYTWEEFGFRLGGHSNIYKVVDEILGAPIPPQAPPAVAA